MTTTTKIKLNQTEALNILQDFCQISGFPTVEEAFWYIRTNEIIGTKFTPKTYPGFENDDLNSYSLFHCKFIIIKDNMKQELYIKYADELYPEIDEYMIRLKK
jgi:hypothetical protein